MIFNQKSEITPAKNSNWKKLWPDFWNGTVESRFRKREIYEKVVIRRAQEEICIPACSFFDIPIWAKTTKYFL